MLEQSSRELWTITTLREGRCAKSCSVRSAFILNSFGCPGDITRSISPDLVIPRFSRSHCQIDSDEIELVGGCVYLGSLMTADNDTSGELQDDTLLLFGLRRTGLIEQSSLYYKVDHVKDIGSTDSHLRPQNMVNDRGVLTHYRCLRKEASEVEKEGEREDSE